MVEQLARYGWSWKGPSEFVVAPMDAALSAAAPHMAPKPTGSWAIDTSAGTPILVYDKCSVIEDDQARYVLGLIAADMAPQSAASAARDAERLDYLESKMRHHGDGYTEPREAFIGFGWQQGPDQETFPGLRIAIGAAMVAQESEYE